MKTQQPDEPWFRARRSEHGTGYSLIHWKGAAAVTLIAVACAGIGAAPALIFGPTDIAAVAGVVIALPAFAVMLLALVRAKAERWEG